MVLFRDPHPSTAGAHLINPLAANSQAEDRKLKTDFPGSEAAMWSKATESFQTPPWLGAVKSQPSCAISAVHSGLQVMDQAHLLST